MAKRRAHKKVHRGRRRKRGFATWSLGKRIGVIVLSLVLTIVIGGGAAAAAFMASKMDKMEVKELNAEALEINKEVEHKTGYLNVALFGVDSRDASLGKGTRSDTIMIASLNQETGEIRLCSVYRDTLLQQSDGRYDKANSAYSYGGVEGAVALLNKNLDLNIEHYVTVNFDALTEVIDAVGGVEVDVQPEEVSYICGYMIEIMKVTGRESVGVTEPGPQVLNGLQATAYCRIRYTKGDDFRRTERQREVLQKVAEKLQTSNLATLNKIIDKVFSEVGTNFTLPEILSYAKDFKHYKLGETTGFPFDKTTDTLNGIGSTVIPVGFANNVTQLHQFLFGEDGYTPSSVVNSVEAGIRKKAGDVKAASDEELANYKSDDKEPSTGGGGKDTTKPSTGGGGNTGGHTGGGTGGTGGAGGGAGGDAGGGTGGDAGGGAGGAGEDPGGDAGGGAGGDAGGEAPEA